MIPPDMMGAAPAPAGAIPPDIAGLLGAPGPAAPGAGLPEEAAPEGDPQAMYDAAMDATEDPVTLVRWALDAMRKAAAIEGGDQDTLKLEKATTAAAQYLADIEKEGDELIQGKSSPNSMRRAAGGLAESY